MVIRKYYQGVLQGYGLSVIVSSEDAQWCKCNTMVHDTLVPQDQIYYHSC